VNALKMIKYVVNLKFELTITII